MEQPELEAVLVWDVGVTGGIAHCAIRLAPDQCSSEESLIQELPYSLAVGPPPFWNVVK